MTEYLIYFNQQWVGDHTEEWFRSRGPLAMAVVQDMKDAGVYVFAGGLDHASPAYAADATSGTVLITDGPFVETTEFLGGFAVVDVTDDEDAGGLHLVEDRPDQRTAPAEPLLGVVADPLLVEVDEVLGHGCSSVWCSRDTLHHLRVRRWTNPASSVGKLLVVGVVTVGVGSFEEADCEPVRSRVLDLPAGALPEVAADVDDEDLVRHRDLLQVYPAEPRAFLCVELRGRVQGGRGQHHVSGERQLGLETLELVTEAHGTAQRDDGKPTG